MFKSFRQDAHDLELIDIEQYTIFNQNDEFCIRLGKTKTKKYLVIQAQYECNNKIDSFQTKLTVNNLKEKSKYFNVVSNVDESYTIFKNLFEINEVSVKDIINKNYLKLVFNFQKKDLEINLPYRKNETNFFFQKKYPAIEEINFDENLNINEIQHVDEIPKENIEKNQKEEDNIENNKDENFEGDKIDINEIKNGENNIEIEDKKEVQDNFDNNNLNENEIENKNNKNEDNHNNNNDEIINDNLNIQENKDNDDNVNNLNHNEENNNFINEDNNEAIIKENDENVDSNLIEKESTNSEIKDSDKDIGKEEKIDDKVENNNIYLNELLEKIKNLEEENKQLKKENNELKEKLSKISFNEDKLKKSEKEKEKLKIELQQLKNIINDPNQLNRRRTLEDKISINNSNNGDIAERQKTLVFQSRLDLYQTKNKKNQNKNNSIKEEKNTIKENKEQINPNTINFQSKSPINLKIHKTVTQSSYIPYSIDNTFTAFTSLKDELFLVYATKMKSIECFDLIKNKFHKAILNAHNGQILTIRHYCPKMMNKDLILSGSNEDYSVKIWDLETWSSICNINKIYQKGNMYSVCILFDEYQNESYIYTSSDIDFIKIYDFNGKFINNINKTNNNEIFFIDTFYDKRDYKYYLISGEMRCVKSYELNTHQLFRIYNDNNSYCEHLSAFVYIQGGITKLVESEFFGSVRVWNFHTGNLIKKIDICRRIPLVSMCLWNENYLLVSCVDYTIKLVDFKNYALIKSFTGHNNEVCTIKKIIHPTFEECLLSQGLYNEQIKLWVNG